jgi:hypothetical protein
MRTIQKQKIQKVKKKREKFKGKGESYLIMEITNALSRNFGF